MVRFISLLLFIGLAFWGCENKGIINGGYYKNDNMDRINTYHLYDFISIEKQMSFRGKRNTMALKLGQHCYSYFVFKYGASKEIIEFPAIMPSGKPIWPEYWKKEELEKIQANLPVMSWEAQYQQKPTSEEGAIIKREWWKTWEKEDMPELVHIIQSYDTAFSKKDSADYSAISTWGIFKTGFNQDNIILLDCMKDRWEFPELKRVALEQYKYWEPETIIVEAKASGQPLIQEMRQIGIPVVSYSPSKGNDKLSRVNSVSPIFESGQVWAPEKKFAEEMIEECAAFPYGEHDDLVDSMTQAMMRYRQGHFIALKDDYDDPIKPIYEQQPEYY